MIKKLLLLIFLLLPITALAQERVIPRTIIALHDGNEIIEQTWMHQMAEMPLNHLGLKLEYHSIKQPLPKLKNRSDVRGIISWFSPGTTMEDPLSYIKWVSDAVTSGKKFIIMGDSGFLEDNKSVITPKDDVNKLLNLIGISDKDEWISLTYDVDVVYQNKELVQFERKLFGFLHPYQQIVPIHKKTKSHLVVRKNHDTSTDSHLVVTHSNGGYIAEGYSFYYDPKGEVDLRQWYINPFIFFREAFATSDVPKPDTNTLAGKRLFYSHIDGDGWNNLTQLEEYKGKNTLSSQVVMDKIIRKYSDFPITVGIIAADIDKDWVGTNQSIKIARELLALPNVEVASHTYSHPFYWSFFADENAEKERPYLSKYKTETWDESNYSWINILNIMDFWSDTQDADNKLLKGYALPRAYAKEPFDLDLEIAGSVKAIEKLLPSGKKVKIMQWSGDTSPFEHALKLARKEKLLNINGGDSRFDQEYPSYGWVSPIGKQVGNEQQIYASNSNENTYTDLWTGKFHGFKHLVKTIDNTETPIRVKPINIYYHMYSGEKQASLNALIDNMEYARKQEIIPVTTSNYIKIANGFYSSKIMKTGTDRWKIRDRGELQTIRFDNSVFKTVDFVKSTGVIGQKHYQGSLYIYLDESVSEPLIALTDNDQFYKEPDSVKPYIVESSYKAKNAKYSGSKTTLDVEGFGVLKMVWKVPSQGTYVVSIADTQKSYKVGSNKLLTMDLGKAKIGTITIVMP